jgi:hypothetical protein
VDLQACKDLNAELKSEYEASVSTATSLEQTEFQLTEELQNFRQLGDDL